MILKLIGLSEDPDLVSYHEGTSIVYNPNSQEFMLYKGTQIEETIAFSDYSEPDCGHKVVAYLMENGKTVDRYVSEPANNMSNAGIPSVEQNSIEIILRDLIAGFDDFEDGFIEVASVLDVLIGKDSFGVQIDDCEGHIIYPLTVEITK